MQRELHRRTLLNKTKINTGNDVICDTVTIPLVFHPNILDLFEELSIEHGVNLSNDTLALLASEGNYTMVLSLVQTLRLTLGTSSCSGSM